MLNKIARYLWVFFLSVIIATVLGCIASTHFVLAGLIEIGVTIPLSDRIFMTLFDLGMGRVLGIMFTGCFFIAFIIAGICARWLPGNRQFWFGLGGAMSILVLLISMNEMVGGMPIAGARTLPGLLFQGLAGGVAGWIFALLTSTKKGETVT